MSLPTFPPISPEITREKSLNMILASIAMEELAFSHIINAEGEKIQYVVNDLIDHTGSRPSLEDVLAVNKSVESLLSVVMQSQIFLKSKMDKVLDVMPPEKPDHKPPSTCIASFSETFHDYLWKTGTPLPWDKSFIKGNCIVLDKYDCGIILLEPNKHYLIAFSINLTPICNCTQNIKVSLTTSSADHYEDLFTYYKPYTHSDHVPISISASGILLSTHECHEDVSLSLILGSPDSIKSGESHLTIIEY